MTLSARNVFRGTIVNATRGATTAHVKIDVGGKTVVTASITMEAVDARGLEKVTPPWRRSRPLNVMVGKA